MRAVPGFLAPLVVTAIVVAASLSIDSLRAAERLRRPLGLDLYRPVPDENPLTPPRVDLGRRLFHERRLSRDASMACASCHDPKRSFTNGKKVGKGVRGVRGTRNVPTIVNRAWGKSFFWDGRAATLEEQVLQPILHRDELDMTAERVVAVATSDRYRSRFIAAFGSEAREPIGSATQGRPSSSGSVHPTALKPKAHPPGFIDPYDGLNVDAARTLRQVALALAAYVRTIQVGDSPYDRYVAGSRSALSDSARRGLDIFRGKGGCTACHVGPTLSDEDFHNTGVAWRTGVLTDEGRARVTRVAADRGAFKTPTLREVARTAPYMHDGSFATLPEVIAFYDRGGSPNPGLDRQLRPLKLTSAEKQDLLAFLHSVSGKSRDGD
jgi:cytochrome c peroxidase